MPHANITILPTQSVQVSEPHSSFTQDVKFPILSAPDSNTTTLVAPQPLDTQSTISHASIFTQTTPTQNLPFLNDVDAYIPISLWQTHANHLQTLKEHVNALL